MLYFMNHADQGGAALALYDLIKEIKNNHNDIEPIVITGKRNRLNEMFDNLGVENYAAPFKNFISSYHSPVAIWKIAYFIRYYTSKKRAIKQIENYIDFSTIDLIHSNLNRIDIGACLSKKYNIPHIWHVREFGEKDFKLLSFKKDPIDYMNSFANIFIFISKAVKSNWEMKGLDCTNSSMIYDGVRTEQYQKCCRKSNNILRGIFLGGYCDSKGQIDLIEALGLLPKDDLKNIKVDFFGNGKSSYIKKLKSRSKQLGIEESVSFFDYDPNITQKLCEYDVGFNCSVSEGFGRVTVEYMANELCPIVSSGGANTEIVKDNFSGLVYDCDDIYRLSELIKYAINNRNEICSMGLRARDSANKRFTMNIHANEIVRLYKKVKYGKDY